MNREEILQQLHRAAEKLRMKNTNVLRVVLFGSFVRNDYGPRSDADILVVVASDNRRAIDRIPEYLDAFSGVSIGVDIFPFTEEEIQKALREESWFVKHMLQEGMELGGKKEKDNER